MALYQTGVPQAGMSRERAGISAASTSTTSSRPAGAPVPHEQARTPYHKVLFMHRAFTSPAPVTPAPGHRSPSHPAPKGAAGRSPGQATPYAWRSPGISFAPPSSPERGGRGCFSPQAKKPPPRCSRHFRECGQRADISQLGASRSQQRHGQKTMPQRRTTPQQSEETIPLQDYLPLQP